MLTVTLKPDIAEQIEELAGQTHVGAEELVDQAVRAYLEQARSSPSTLKRRRYSFVASGRTRNSRASVNAEDILERKAEPRDGWSPKP